MGVMMMEEIVDEVEEMEVRLEVVEMVSVPE